MSESQSSEPLVSIVTPTFRMAASLRRCIESVQSQGYANIEQIVVDGGSNDGTVQLLEAADGVRWVSEPDNGQSDALNKGFKMAKGSILTWLNADDELGSGAIRRAVDAFSANPGAGVVYGDIEVVEGGTTKRVPPDGPFTSAALWRGNVVSQPGTFFLAEAFWDVGGIDESFHLAMDYELWLRLAAAGVTGVYVPEVMARFVVHEESKTGSRSLFEFVEEEARALRKNGDVHGAAMAIDRWYWDKVIREVGAALETDPAAARALARSSLTRMHPVRSRVRGFLTAAAWSPRLARMIYRRTKGAS